MKKIEFFFFFPHFFPPPALSWEKLHDNPVETYIFRWKIWGFAQNFPIKNFCWKILARANHLTCRNRDLQAICLYIDCKIWTWKDPGYKAEEWSTNKLRAKMFTVTGASDESLLQLCAPATFLGSIWQMVCVWQFPASISSPPGHYSACSIAKPTKKKK